MSGTANRIFQTIKPHVPLIKFRKGGLTTNHAAPAAAQSFVSPATSMPSTPVASASASSKPLATTVHSLEWWQTPEKYKKREIDDIEIDMINSGGSDRYFQ